MIEGILFINYGSMFGFGSDGAWSFEGLALRVGV
jgi:hypothetical protein